MKRTYIIHPDTKKFVEIGIAEKRLPNLGIIEDTMADTAHPATGMVYDSKSQYRRFNKENGYFEIGTTPAERLMEIQQTNIRDNIENRLNSRREVERRCELIQKYLED